MSSPGWADLYAWRLDRASRTPLTRQIYMQVRSAVLSGALGPGTRVPSSRDMALRLGVARASVVAAYEHLLAEGCVESRRGSATFTGAWRFHDVSYAVALLWKVAASDALGFRAEIGATGA